MKETVLSKPQVLKRLHLSLEQFRSLCLIRGIHPRQYKQKKYFYRKADVHSLIRSEEIQAVRKKQAIDYSSLLQMRFPAFIDILPHLSDIVHGVLIHSQNITILSKLYSEFFLKLIRLSRIGAFQKCFISVKGIYLGVSIEQIVFWSIFICPNFGSSRILQLFQHHQRLSRSCVMKKRLFCLFAIICPGLIRLKELS